MLRVRTIGTASNRDGIGATVTVTLDDGQKRWAMVKTGSSYCSQSELPLTFGLGAATKVEGRSKSPGRAARSITCRRSRPTRPSRSQEGKGRARARPPFDRRRHDAALSSSLAIAGCSSPAPSAAARTPRATGSSGAYRANNVGVAQLEQFDYDAAADVVPPGAADRRQRSALAQLNLAIALLYGSHARHGARPRREAAAAALPDAPQPPYVLGLIAKADNRLDDAIAAFRRVLAIDPTDAAHEGQSRAGATSSSARSTRPSQLFRAALERRAVQRDRGLQPRDGADARPARPTPVSRRCSASRRCATAPMP